MTKNNFRRTARAALALGLATSVGFGAVACGDDSSNKSQAEKHFSNTEWTYPTDPYPDVTSTDRELADSGIPVLDPGQMADAPTGNFQYFDGDMYSEAINVHNPADHQRYSFSFPDSSSSLDKVEEDFYAAVQYEDGAAKAYVVHKELNTNPFSSDKPKVYELKKYDVATGEEEGGFTFEATNGPVEISQGQMIVDSGKRVIDMDSGEEVASQPGLEGRENETAAEITTFNSTDEGFISLSYNSVSDNGPGTPGGETSLRMKNLKTGEEKELLTGLNSSNFSMVKSFQDTKSGFAIITDGNDAPNHLYSFDEDGNKLADIDLESGNAFFHAGFDDNLVLFAAKGSDNSGPGVVEVFDAASGDKKFEKDGQSYGDSKYGVDDEYVYSVEKDEVLRYNIESGAEESGEILSFPLGGVKNKYWISAFEDGMEEKDLATSYSVDYIDDLTGYLRSTTPHSMGDGLVARSYNLFLVSEN